MKVTPVNKKFGKYSPGDVFDFPDKPAKVFIKIGKLADASGYQTRMLQAEVSVTVDTVPASVAVHPSGVVTFEETPENGSKVAPYGLKADGTPRKRPGRTKASE